MYINAHMIAQFPHQPQFLVNDFEARSVRRIVRPTLRHQMVEAWRAGKGEGQPVSVLYPLSNILVLDAHKRLHTSHHNLPGTHTCGGQSSGGHRSAA